MANSRTTISDAFEAEIRRWIKTHENENLAEIPVGEILAENEIHLLRFTRFLYMQIFLMFISLVFISRPVPSVDILGIKGVDLPSIVLVVSVCQSYLFLMIALQLFKYGAYQDFFQQYRSSFDPSGNNVLHVIRFSSIINVFGYFARFVTHGDYLNAKLNIAWIGLACCLIVPCIAFCIVHFAALLKAFMIGDIFVLVKLSFVAWTLLVDFVAAWIIALYTTVPAVGKLDAGDSGAREPEVPGG